MNLQINKENTRVIQSLALEAIRGLALKDMSGAGTYEISELQANLLTLADLLKETTEAVNSDKPNENE